MMQPPSQPSLFLTEAGPPYVVIGNEHSLYRDVLSSTLATLRPEMSVLNAPPIDLDAIVYRLQPLLVICSALSAAIENRAGAWILLHPDVHQQTIVGVQGARRSMPHPELGELVQLIDDLLVVITGLGAAPGA